MSCPAPVRHNDESLTLSDNYIMFVTNIYTSYHCSLISPGFWWWHIKEICSEHLGVDSFRVPFHSPNGRHLPAVRAVQGDCHWGLKNGGNSHWSCEPIMQWGTRQSQSIIRPTNHKWVMPVNWRPRFVPHWRPRFVPHWQAYSRQLGLFSSLAWVWSPLVLHKSQ